MLSWGNASLIADGRVWSYIRWGATLEVMGEGRQAKPSDRWIGALLAKVTSCAVVGLDGALVDVEVDISNGMPGFTIVGLPDAAIQESRERVRAAIRNSTLTYPFNKRITVNLAPADLRKEDPAYDLHIAVGLLLASEQIQADLSRALIIGELSLDGAVRHTNGVLPLAALARERGFDTLFVPANDAPEAALVPLLLPSHH